MMAGFLLDTNQRIEGLKPVSRVRDRISRERRFGIKIETCVPVLCELEVGLQRQGRYRSVLERLLRDVRVWPIDPNTAKHYGAIQNELMRLGRALSQVDIMLAALARQQGLTLLTSDRDIEASADLQTDDWTQAPPNTPASPS